ncbi:MAG: restriction endonuclease subunit S [Streptococcus sp.]|nr:restriction endonuclease subunit S [Streptococcus sp.]
MELVKNNAWEQRRLGEVGKCQSGIGFPDCEQGGKVGVPFYKVSDMNNSGNEYEMVTANNYVSDEQIARKNWKPIDDVPAVIFAKVGAAIMLNRKRLCRFPFLLDNNTMAYKFDKSWDIDFGRTMFEKLDLTTLVQVGALPSYNASDVERMMIAVPKDLAEQYEIGVFFRTIDHLITLHQRKYDKTISIKNVMLEKLFPKDSENLPEINFLSFAITWEQRELGELATIVRGASPRPIQDPKWFDEESEIGWLRIADVTEQDGRINYLEQHISKLGQEKTRVLTEPHLLLSIAATVGKPVVNYVKTGVHDGFLIFQEPKFNREFMFQWLEMFRPKWQKYGQPGSQVNLNSDLVKNQRIVLPSEEEQEKIGTFFSQLDHLITLHQRMLLLFITLILI